MNITSRPLCSVCRGIKPAGRPEEDRDPSYCRTPEDHWGPPTPAVKKGDRLVVDGRQRMPYMSAEPPTLPGTVVAFRNTRSYNKKATVLLDRAPGENEDSYMDWLLYDVRHEAQARMQKQTS